MAYRFDKKKCLFDSTLLFVNIGLAIGHTLMRHINYTISVSHYV